MAAGDVLYIDGTQHQAFGSLDTVAALSPILVNETAITTHVLAGPFGCRGRGGLGLFTEVAAASASSVQVMPLTRIAGKPWMWLPALETTNTGVPILSRGTIWPTFGTSAGGAKIPTAWLDGFVGLLEELVVAVVPSANGGGAAATASVGSGGGAIPLTAVDALADAGNRISIELVDPAALSSPLSITSPDGWAIKVHLETDGAGVIVTTATDVALLFGAYAEPNGWLISATAPIDGGAVMSAAGPVAFTGGDGSPAGPVDVIVKGWA